MKTVTEQGFTVIIGLLLFGIFLVGFLWISTDKIEPIPLTDYTCEEVKDSLRSGEKLPSNTASSHMIFDQRFYELSDMDIYYKHNCMAVEE